LLVSNAFSKLLDKRELAAGLPGYGHDLEEDHPAPPYTDASYRDDEGALWLDYAADLGEGFDPTYTVAWLLSRNTLELEPGTVTRRGRALVLGGDQVYPSAKWDAYRDRFVGPYQAALPHLPAAEAPHLFAIPGNHDWYDGLTSFTRLFTQRSWIGAWRTRQRRSYFAVRLSERWWLWGTDIQFDTYLDGPQLEYFRHAAADLEAGHRVILATAKPSWVRAERDREPAIKKEGAWQTLAFVEQNLIGRSKGEVALTLTGDHHFYARYTKEKGEGPEHRITAGGGGAHSMGTATLPAEISPPSLAQPASSARYVLGATSPTPAESRDLREGIVGAVMRVPSLGALIGALYALIALTFADAVKDHSTGLAAPGGDYSLPSLLWDGGSTWSVGLVLLVAGGLVAFADVKRRPLVKGLAGGLHALAHLALALAAPIALILLLDDAEVARHGMLLGWLAAAGAFAIGFVGLLVFGLYLLVLNRSSSGRHSGEVWGGLASTDYKNFLRLKIGADERLTIYPVGIRRSAEWKFEPAGDPGEPWFVPAGGEPEAKLIEPPIVIEP
ncbi:MAG: metallophosphoesterase, partial [Actinomycetota bacterium]|nr:metallophosphoesterase [Actinomycetota bacterium]